MTLIVLQGQTCGGKSDLAVAVAQYLGSSWIVNCDSRQVYEELNLGTGKVEGEWKSSIGFEEKIYIYGGIPHFLIDFVPVARYYTLMNFVTDWCQLFQLHRQLPQYVILTGGTGLYAKAVVEEYALAQRDEEFESRKAEFERLSVSQLQQYYQNSLSLLPVEQVEAMRLNESDIANPRRLVNWLLRQQPNPTPLISLHYPHFDRVYNCALLADQEIIRSKIHTRLISRTAQGMLEEIEEMRQKYGTKRMLDLGLEYRFGTQYLLGQLSFDEFIGKLETAIGQYAKRQMTWLKKQPVVWVRGLEDIQNLLSNQ